VIGEGAYRATAARNSFTPTASRAFVKKIGTRLPEAMALLTPAASFSAETDPFSRYSSIRTSSASTTASTSAECTAAASPKSGLPSACVKQSTTDWPPPAGRLNG